MGQIATSVKSVSGSYNLTRGTALPGYYTGRTKEVEYFGSTTSNGKILPGVPFILGMQDMHIIEHLHDKNALNQDKHFNSPVLFNRNENTTFRGDIQPIPALRINLTANYSQTKNKEVYYTNFEEFVKDPYPVLTGNFSMTVMSFSTFEKLTKDDNYTSQYFKKFLNNRSEIRARLNTINSVDLNDPRLGGDTTGFALNSQQVLIPAFLATYGNYPVKDVPLDLIPKIKFIRPNWNITYDGLTNIPIVADYCRSVTLTHAYSSTYNVGSYQSTSMWEVGKLDANNVFQPKYDARGGVSITEQFSPFIGIDMVWKNNLTSTFQYKKSRSLNLNFSNYDITETRGAEYVIGVGYRFDEVPLKFIPSSGGSSYVKSDLNIRGDFSIRDDYAVLRNFSLAPLATSGILNTTFTLNADYALSEKLTVNLFYKRFLNNPVLQNTYRTTNTDFGFSVRFTLTQ
jgi:cell surface protein SprA